MSQRIFHSFLLILILFSSDNDLLSKLLMSNDKKKELPTKVIFIVILSRITKYSP